MKQNFINKKINAEFSHFSFSKKLVSYDYGHKKTAGIQDKEIEAKTRDDAGAACGNGGNFDAVACGDRDGRKFYDRTDNGKNSGMPRNYG